MISLAVGREEATDLDDKRDDAPDDDISQNRAMADDAGERNDETEQPADKSDGGSAIPLADQADFTMRREVRVEHDKNSRQNHGRYEVDDKIRERRK